MNCICCGSGADFKRSLKGYPEYLLFKCCECGLRFLRSDTYETLPDDHYWDEVNRQIYAMPAVVGEFERKHLRLLSKVRRRPLPNNRILDVGSGSGIFVRNSRAAGFNAEGIEPSQIGLSLCKDRFGIDCHAGYLTRDSDLPKTYGVVSAWDVIEHVSDPKDFLDICHAHLGKGGVLLMETPDESSLIRKIVLLVSWLTRKDLTAGMYYPSHRFYFTRKAMRGLLTKAGFGNIRIFGTHSMMVKSIQKLKLYRNPPWHRLLIYRLVFWLMTLRPFWNKQIVLCTKL